MTLTIHPHSQLCSNQVQHDLPTVRTVPVLEYVNTLPGSQRKFAVHQRYRELYLGQGRFQVSRHVVRAF